MGKRKTALITGASGGLGKELANVFAQKGYDLALIARSRERLEELADFLRETYRINALVLPEDLAQEGNGRLAFEKILEKGLQIDVLVNNAGIGAFGDYFRSPWEKQVQMVRLNVLGMMELTHCILPEMMKRGGGKILNIASTSAFQPGPFLAVYSASKAFVLSFTEALSEEIKNSGVYATAVCPGPIRTGFEKAAGLEKSSLFKKLPVAEAREVAQFAYRALEKNKTVAICGGSNRVMYFLAKLSPKALARKASLWVLKEYKG